MLHLWNRKGNYWARGSFNDQTVKPWPLDTRDRNIAQRLLHNREVELLQQIEHPGRERLTWPELVRRFTTNCQNTVKPSSLKRYNFVTHRFGLFLESAGITWSDAVTPGIIERYLDDRRTDTHPTRKGITCGKEGLKSDQRILQQVFNFAIEREYFLARNPIRTKRLHGRARNTQPFSEAETQAMLSDHSPRAYRHLQMVVLLFLHTGLRISDMIHFERESIDRAAGYLRLVTRKRDKPVMIPIKPELDAALAAHLAALRHSFSPLLFP